MADVVIEDKGHVKLCKMTEEEKYSKYKEWGCKLPKKYEECDWSICKDGCTVVCQFCGGRADCICGSCEIPLDAECDAGSENYTLCPTCAKIQSKALLT